MIVLQSLTARIGFIALAKWLSFTSNSERMRFILVSVFLIYFLNYGVLYLIAPLSINLPIVSKILRGIYPDFNQAWFGDIGNQIISVMLINAIMPPIEVFFLWLWSYVRRAYDQGRCCRKVPPSSTKEKTLFGFKNLYCGLEYDIYYKYS